MAANGTQEQAIAHRGGPRRTGWAALVSAATLVAAGLVLSGSTAAQAVDPAALCTSGHPEPGPDVPAYRNNADGWPQPIPGEPGGRIFVFYEGVTGHNCAVVVSNGSGGAYIDVGLRRSDGTGPDWDSGGGTHAGPVYVKAPGVCIDVTGAVGERSFSSSGTNCEE
ncbi:hypothetical protein [Nocardiopsis metallicus]|uniref:Uncharacterized protein n=1 Tax=Nocardiopsis metallicus TaxID=179819 RepID=A0A840WGU1_9ACTN|nr:hypothetical protein [Nocardiopsis metallicus]MBB5490626.1 hypothetical protein [Nocardiopsis metallicus]